jgi:hypothetical protein
LKNSYIPREREKIIVKKVLVQKIPNYSGLIV